MVKDIISRFLVSFGIWIILFSSITMVVDSTKEEKNITNSNKQASYAEKKTNKRITDLKKLIEEKNNLEIIGALEIESIDLYSVVTKTYDNSYYQNHNIGFEVSEKGNPFIDYRVDDIASDRLVVIYGNYNNNGINKINTLLNRDRFNKNTIINLYLEDKILSYELVLVETNGVNLQGEKLNSDRVVNKLIDNAKYCKDYCKIGSDDDLLIIELFDKAPSSNLIVVAKKIIDA